jgi:hypothetical protein
MGGRSRSDIALINGGVQFIFNERYLLRGSAAVECGGRRENLNGAVSFGINF